MRVLRDKSGVSLIFVLAAMLLLMAIGVSVITAAGFNLGAGFAQRDRNQLEMFASSMERTIRAMLMESETGEPVLDTHGLSARIMRDIYLHDDARGILEYSLTPDMNDDWSVEYTVNVSADMHIEVFEPIVTTVWEPIWEDDPENPDGEQICTGYTEVVIDRSPQRAILNGVVKVTQTTVYQRVLGGEPLSTTTVTTYLYSGGLLEERAGYDITQPPDDSDMLIADSGAWTVTRHDKISN